MKNTMNKKVLGEERRELILEWLKNESAPLTGSDLAKRTNVSRQVIVQDISILKARNLPILATSQGYIYVKNKQEDMRVSRVIACHHKPESTKEELTIIVDHGATVKNVIVEHPIYGDLTASLMLRSRRDVEDFLKKVDMTKAPLLSILTDGTHLHTIEADTTEQLDDVCSALEKAGYLLKQNV
ncbi:transcription repressor NadR [Anaerobacillus sp. MEB173]|uniref:transcription repressor NadR n=1 Tax=Anaerobacillus sp. MEB173 TaxID=3383345 RepID=UPI003F8EC03C